MTRLGLLLVLIVATCLPLAAQQPAPAFEVASVKPNMSGRGSMSIGWEPGGSFRAANAPLVVLIQTAFGLRDHDLVGAPAWATSERYDVTARAPGEIDDKVGRSILQALLRERFKLRVRTETREMLILELRLARSDGRVGPNLQDCSNPNDKATERTYVAPTGGSVAAGACSNLASLVNIASGQLDAHVVNKTGLTGQWRYNIVFSDEGPQEKANPDLPSFVAALQEQLGLRLERTRGPVPVVVIESVERPTPD